ncbi:MAG: hypothetical protein M1817_002124 [Caeruleum heppii]|nr:MAG: hypothetical protein M1817_002124 [Caeruleum heppii]
MAPPSLHQLARRSCIKNIKLIRDVGEIPYERIRHVLLKVENPEQLREIELASPQIVGEDHEIWRAMIKRDIPQWWTKPHEPKNPKNWYKVYKKLYKDNEAQVERDMEKLKAAMDDYSAQKAKNTSKLVDMASLPDLRKHTRVGARPTRAAATTSTRTAGNSALLTFNSGSKTKNVMQKVRREAREMSLFSAAKSALSKPTHQLHSNASQVKAAPKGLVDDHKKPATPLDSSRQQPTAPVILPPSKKLTAKSRTTPVTDRDDKERRLKELTTRHTMTPSTKRNRDGVPIASSSKKPSAAAASPTSKHHTANTLRHTPEPYTSTSASTSDAEIPKSYRAPRLKTPSPERGGQTISTPGSGAGGPPAKRRKREVNIFMPRQKRSAA